MNRTHRITPTYTGDVSGACSALFELGGMVVIHDPSGCNSTYNTHDETRWYDRDSLIFITGLTERDAVLGNDNKLVHDVVDAARELHPRFIALCNSPVPLISGTDFAALARLIEQQTNIPTFYVRTNGMHDYVVGAGNAFAALAEKCVLPTDPLPNSLNILGVTPLDFGGTTRPSELDRFAAEAGFEVASCWAMGSTPDEITHAAKAGVNLVVSATGLAAAKVLHRRFGTPYVVGRPCDAFAPALAQALRDAAQAGRCAIAYNDVRRQAGEGSVTTSSRFAIGEPVALGSLAAAHLLNTKEPTCLVCPLESCDELLGANDLRVYGEEEVELAIAYAHVVIADPLYAPIIPPQATLVPHPHFAFSGRQSQLG